MLVRPIVLFLVISPAVVVAQDLLSCVDPDVKQALVFQGFDGDTVVSRELPKAFADFRAPEIFEFIGSSVSSLQTTVAYKTSLAAETALNDSVESLVDSGWQEFPNVMPQTGGFRNSSQPSYSNLCREDQMSSVIARRVGESTFVNMSTTSNQGNFSCSTMMSSPAMGGRDRGLSEHMPTLSLPEGTSNPRGALFALGMGGASSDSRTARTSIAVSTQMSAQELVDDFGQQLGEQKWRMDAQWSGRLSTGSTWSTQPNDTTSLFGALDIVRIAESSYQAYFRITRID